MKKTIFILAMVVGMVSISAQTYSPIKKKKIKKDDFSITIKESEKNQIDWKFVKDFFSDKKENDSIQFSVKLIPQKEGNLKVGKKYSVRGIKKNIDDLVLNLQKMLK